MWGYNAWWLLNQAFPDLVRFFSCSQFLQCASHFLLIFTYAAAMLDSASKAHTTWPSSFWLYGNHGTDDRGWSPYDMWRHTASAAEHIKSAYTFHPACSKTLTQFQHYLLVLRWPGVLGVFKHQLKVSDVSRHQPGDLGTTTVSPKSIVQLIRASLYLENVDGFGDWQIFLLTTVWKYLWKTRCDGLIFEIVLKKMKWGVPSPPVTDILTW